jgi:hypothetical protein
MRRRRRRRKRLKECHDNKPLCSYSFIIIY